MTDNTKKGLFSSCSLHVLAMALMLLDHMWATLFMDQAWMTCVGRIAYPIFAFMIVEGYFHTRNFKKYILRMLIFALISEVPFDLIYGGIPFYPFHQNVLWTFLIALLLIRFLEFVHEKKGLGWYIAASVLAVLVGLVVGTVTMVDYYGAGVLVVLMFYFLRKRTWYNFVLQVLVLYYIFVELIGGYYYPVTIFGHYFELQQEAFGLLGLIPVWLYTGRQGYHKKWFQYFCYAFYPGHLLILYIIFRLAAH